MPERFEQIVDYMVRSVADHPDDIRVSSVEGEASLLLELRVNPEDLDQVSGPDRTLFRAMQQVMAVSSRNAHQKPVLDLIENDDGGEEE